MLEDKTVGDKMVGGKTLGGKMLPTRFTYSSKEENCKKVWSYSHFTGSGNGSGTSDRVQYW